MGVDEVHLALWSLVLIGSSLFQVGSTMMWRCLTARRSRSTAATSAATSRPSRTMRHNITHTNRRYNNNNSNSSNTTRQRHQCQRRHCRHRRRRPQRRSTVRIGPLRRNRTQHRRRSPFSRSRRSRSARSRPSPELRSEAPVDPPAAPRRISSSRKDSSNNNRFNIPTVISKVRKGKWQSGKSRGSLGSLCLAPIRVSQLHHSKYIYDLTARSRIP